MEGEGAENRGSGLGAAVDRDDGGVGVGGAGAGEEGDGGADFFRGGGAAVGHRGGEFAPAVGVAEFGFGAVAEQAFHALGGDRAGVDGDGADAVFVGAAAEPAGEGMSAALPATPAM